MNTEMILQTAEQIAGSWDWVTELSRPESNRLDIRLTRLVDLVPMIVGLRVKRLGYLGAITGLDHGPENGGLEVLYHFFAGEAVITLRVSLTYENPVVPTLGEIIPAAEPYERELSEMFGITVTGLRNPERLYLPEDWPAQVFPLRKDFDPAVLEIRNKKELQA
jgi:Ni,Fe-hydrogenase III component G